jgi:glutaredoxin 2
MKKYIVLAILASLGLSQFFSGFEVFSKSSSTSSNTEKYVKKTEQTVKTYITRLEKSGFSSSDIIATLEKVKTLYMKKKSDNNYTGIKKITVDAIISALEKAINERK